MTPWFANGHIVDLILGGMVIEAAVLIVYHRRSARGPAPIDLLPNLASGACLMLALRVALAGAGWFWIAIALAAALFCHLADLGRRWQAPELPARSDIV